MAEFEQNDRKIEAELALGETIKLSIREHESLVNAAKIVKKGYPIGVVNRGVVAIWGDGANQDYVDRVADIKGEARKAKTLAATLPTEEVTRYIDYSLIPPELQAVFSQSEELAHRIGSLCFIRVPITEDAAKILPSSMVLRQEGQPPILQNWDPRGHKPAENLIKEMLKEGIRFPSATSMNKSGQPEIVDPTEGYEFSKKEKIPLFLYDPKDPERVKGSYTIFSITGQGVRLERDGNIPADFFSTLFGTQIIKDNYKTSNYVQYPFPQLVNEGMDPRAARIAILGFTQGK